MIRQQLLQISEDLKDEAVAHLVEQALQLRAMPEHRRAETRPHLLLVDRGLGPTVPDLPRKAQPIKMHVNRPAKWVAHQLAFANFLLKLKDRAQHS